MTREFHIFSGVGVAIAGVTMAVAAKAEWISTAAAAPPDDFGEMESIEASLAYKKATPKQPQKKQREAVHEKVEGVSHDADKPADPTTKVDPPKHKPDDNAPGPTAKIDDDEDTPIGKPTDEPVGQFDGSDFGFAEESKGDPYFQALVGDFIKAGGEYPSILAAAGAPVECFHLDADGKVVDTKLKEKSEEDALNDWAEHAAKGLKNDREDHPQPVPAHLLKAATTRWICLKIKL